MTKRIQMLAVSICTSALLLFTSCAQETSADDEPTVIINGSALSQEEIAAYSPPEVEPTVNDGNFYFMGDTNACYYTVKDGTIQFIADDKEKLRYYYYVCAASYYLVRRKEGLSPGPYEEFDEFYESLGEKKGYPEAVPYTVHTTILGTSVLIDPYYDEAGVGGIGLQYIDENNFGTLGSERGGIDIIFTRIDKQKQ